LVGGLTLSKKFFGNFIILFLIGITTGRTNFKFQTFAKPRSLVAIFVRHFITILSFGFLSANICSGQKSNYVTFPDSLKKASVNFSPYIINGILPGFYGVLKTDEPFDSIKSTNSLEYLFQTEYQHDISDSVLETYKNQKGLEIIIDTAQEIFQDQQFYATYKYDSMYASPRYLTVIGKNGSRNISLKKEKIVRMTATPVYIKNVSDDNRKVYDQDFHLNIIQEVLDPKGNWQEIEMYQSGSCGMAWGWKTLPPNTMIVTSILKYNGDYKTLARVKFDNGTIYFSEPYSINVNSKIFSDKIRTTLVDGFIMELK